MPKNLTCYQKVVDFLFEICYNYSMTGFEAFTLYYTLKLHFTTDYDYFKYNGKSGVSIDAFEKRKDKYHFYKLSRKIQDSEYKEFIISNLIEQENCWAGTLLQEDANIIHMKRMSIIQGLSYNFSNDCHLINDRGNFNNLVKTNGEYPELLMMILHNAIKLETLCVLNSLMNFMPMWNKKITDNIRWPTLHKKWSKYTPFLNFDKNKFRDIARKELK